MPKIRIGPDQNIPAQLQALLQQAGYEIVETGSKQPGDFIMLTYSQWEDLFRNATQDSLTKLLNRQTFNNKAQKQLARALRKDEPVSLIMLDLDHFKKINDTRGHQAGDKILVELSNILQGFCREYDLVGRYGGEEFVLLIPHSNLEQTIAIASRLKQQILEAIQVTVSIGIAAYKNNEQLFDLIARADKALYEAKTLRNSIAVNDDCRNRIV
jgi:diguanylate cyclase (GGDEF)-like protein